MMSVRALQEVFFDEVCDDLCVGLCGEAVALFDELPLQRNIVLDNSVVHHYHAPAAIAVRDRKSTRLNSSHITISYAVFCLKKKKTKSNKEDKLNHNRQLIHL